MKIEMRNSLFLLIAIFFFSCIASASSVSAAEAGVEGRYLTKFDLQFNTSTSSMFESSTTHTKLNSTSGHLKNLGATTNGLANVISNDWSYLVSLVPEGVGVQDIWISQWIYSEYSDSGKRLPIFLSCKALSGSTVTTSSAYYLPLDWNGWKLVSIPLSAFKRSDDSFNYEEITRINYCRSWGNDIQNNIIDDSKVDLYLDPTVFLSLEPVAEFGIEQANIREGDDDVSPLTALELTYTYPLAEDAYSAQMIKEDNSVVDCNIAVNENIVTVQPVAQLDFGKMYTLHVSAEAEDRFFSQTDLSITHDFVFGTMDEQVLLGDIQLSADELPASGDITASVEVLAEAPQDTVTLFIVLYDGNGIMRDLVFDDEIEMAGDVQQLQVTMTRDDYTGCRIVAFATYGENSLHLATPSFISLPAESSDEVGSSAEKSQFTDFSAKIEGNDLHIDGHMTSACRRSILLWVTDEKGNVIYISPEMRGPDESFSSVVNLESLNIESGNYTIHATGRKITEIPQPVELFYLSIALQDKLITGINESSSWQDIQKLFNTGDDGEAYKKGFVITELSDNELNNIYRTLYEQKSFVDYNGVFAMVSESQLLLKELNESTWADLHDFVETNSSIILQGEEYFGAYANDAMAINTIYNALMSEAPFSDFADFRAKLKTEVENYEPKSTVKDGGSKGGGGSSIRNNIIVANDIISNPVQQKTDDEPTLVFNDLQSVSWAEEAIQALYQRGILSAPVDGRFRPMDNVTREEFLKMLVEALGFSDGDATHGFKDVDASQWYAKYVNIAWKNGITGGTGDGTFGIGELISREDMAVMIFRAAALRGHSFEGNAEDISFNDEAAISEYALEAVRAMSAAGIINGMDNYRFEPKQSASRAQSAKVIYEYVTVIERGGEQ